MISCIHVLSIMKVEIIMTLLILDLHGPSQDPTNIATVP